MNNTFAPCNLCDDVKFVLAFAFTLNFLVEEKNTDNPTQKQLCCVDTQVNKALHTIEPSAEAKTRIVEENALVFSWLTSAAKEIAAWISRVKTVSSCVLPPHQTLWIST